MGYTKGNAIGTLMKVTETKLGQAARAYERLRKSNGKDAHAKKMVQMHLNTAGKAIASITKKLKDKGGERDEKIESYLNEARKN